MSYPGVEARAAHRTKGQECVIARVDYTDPETIGRNLRPLVGRMVRVEVVLSSRGRVQEEVFVGRLVTITRKVGWGPKAMPHQLVLDCSSTDQRGRHGLLVPAISLRSLRSVREVLAPQPLVEMLGADAQPSAETLPPRLGAFDGAVGNAGWARLRGWLTGHGWCAEQARDDSVIWRSDDDHTVALPVSLDGLSVHARRCRAWQVISEAAATEGMAAADLLDTLSEDPPAVAVLPQPSAETETPSLRAVAEALEPAGVLSAYDGAHVAAANCPRVDDDPGSAVLAEEPADVSAPPRTGPAVRCAAAPTTVTSCAVWEHGVPWVDWYAQGPGDIGSGLRAVCRPGALPAWWGGRPTVTVLSIGPTTARVWAGGGSPHARAYRVAHHLIEPAPGWPSADGIYDHDRRPLPEHAWRRWTLAGHLAHRRAYPPYQARWSSSRAAHANALSAGTLQAVFTPAATTSRVEPPRRR